MYTNSIRFNKHDNNCDSDNINSNGYLIINENCVSKILSCPTDKNIKKILKFIQNNTLDKSYDFLIKIINDDGISLVELINCIYNHFTDKIINNNESIIKNNLQRCVQIIKKMSFINENLTYCNNDNIQLVSFLSIFYLN